jgi:hypothetical protein
MTWNRLSAASGWRITLARYAPYKARSPDDPRAGDANVMPDNLYAFPDLVRLVCKDL